MPVPSCVALAVSSNATGAGLVTRISNVAVVAAPLGSLAVIATWYTPPADWLALRSMVPRIAPLAGSIARPGGRPAAA